MEPQPFESLFDRLADRTGPMARQVSSFPRDPPSAYDHAF